MFIAIVAALPLVQIFDNLLIIRIDITFLYRYFCSDIFLVVEFKKFKCSHMLRSVRPFYLAFGRSATMQHQTLSIAKTNTNK